MPDAMNPLDMLPTDDKPKADNLLDSEISKQFSDDAEPPVRASYNPKPISPPLVFDYTDNLETKAVSPGGLSSAEDDFWKPGKGYWDGP